MLESEAAVHRTELELPETAAPTQQCGLLIFQPMVHAPVVTGSPIPLEDDFLTSTSCRGGRDYSEHVHWDTLAYSSLHSHLRSYYPRLQALAGHFLPLVNQWPLFSVHNTSHHPKRLACKRM